MMFNLRHEFEIPNEIIMGRRECGGKRGVLIVWEGVEEEEGRTTSDAEVIEHLEIDD